MATYPAFNKWRINNKDKFNEIHRNYVRRRLEKDDDFKVKIACQNRKGVKAFYERNKEMECIKRHARYFLNKIYNRIIEQETIDDDEVNDIVMQITANCKNDAVVEYISNNIDDFLDKKLGVNDE